MGHIGQKMTILLTLVAVGSFFLGRGYEQAKARYAIWRDSPSTGKFRRTLQTLAVVCLLTAAAVLAVQARH